MKIKKHGLIFWGILIFVLQLLTSSITVYADNGNTIVYVTNTGECYHTLECGFLRSINQTTLYEAVVENRYRPCEKCLPPIYDGPMATNEPYNSSYDSGKNNSSNVKNKDTSSASKNTSSANEKSSEEIEWLVVLGGVGLFFAVNIAKDQKEQK